MTTTMNGWLIEEVRGKFCASRCGVNIGGFATLDDIKEAIRTRPTLDGLLENMNRKTEMNMKRI